MTDSKPNLSVVQEGQTNTKPMTADEFASGFMKFAESLVDFENNTKGAGAERKVRVASLSSLRVKAPKEKLSDLDAEASSPKDSATVMAFRKPAPDSGSK